MLISLILLTVVKGSAQAHQPDRHANIHRRQNHEIVIIVPDACWWGASGAPTEIGVCSEAETKMDITQIYTTKTTSPATFIFGGLTQEGTATLPDGTIHMVPVDVMSCTAGWLINPTADVTFTMPASATTHYASLVTSGGAFFACGTDCPTAMPSSALSSVPTSASSAGPSTSTSGSGGGSSSATVPSPSITSPPDPCRPSRRDLYRRNDTCPSISASNVGLSDDLPEGQVWLTLPDPHISVHPHTAMIGNWDAAGPFAHLFSFHAWVPTYLNETFDIAVLGGDNQFTSRTMCSIGLLHWTTGKAFWDADCHVYVEDFVALGTAKRGYQWRVSALLGRQWHGR